MNHENTIWSDRLKISFGNIIKYIGDEKVFIIAEMGINHNGDIELAKKIILAAKRAGADAVKIQNYKTSDFLISDNLKYTYINNGKEITVSQKRMFEKYELTYSQIEEIVAFCQKENIILLSTPSGKSGVEEIIKVGIPFIKNASDSLLNKRLLQSMGETGLPCIFSTGMSTLADIDLAVEIFRKTGNNQLALLVCTSNYPTLPHEVNLNRLKTLKQAIGCITGFSDHTIGIYSAIAATVLGAKIIEKHFTIDKNLPGPDHRFSADEVELKLLVDAVHNTEKCLGNGLFQLEEKEKIGLAEFRLSLIYNCDLKKGDKVQEKHLICGRPASGISPMLIDQFVGQPLKKDIKAGTFLAYSDFDFTNTI